MLRRRPVMLDRRTLLADLGRAGMVVAILGSCSTDDDAGDTGDTGRTDDTELTDDTEPTDDTALAEGESPITTGDGSAADRDPSALRWERVALGSVSAYVVARRGEAAVVDTGTPGSEAAIADGLSVLGVGWADVRHVVLTHYHGDHVGSIGEVLASAGAATAYAGEADIAEIDAPQPLSAVGDGDEVFGLQVVHTPGHTAGHICVFDPDSGLLVAGDALTASDDGVLAGPDPQFTADLVAADESVRKLAELPVETILVGHGSPVTDNGGQQLVDFAASI